MYSIDEENSTPFYQQLYFKLRDAILAGTLAPGTRLPSKRVLAEESGVSLITAKHALEMLLDEGYIVSRERSGYFVPLEGSAFRAPGIPKQAGQAIGSGALSHGSAGFPMTAYKSILRRITAEQGERLLQRSPNRGIDELRNAISRYLARFRGMAADPEQILIGSGAEHLYTVLSQLFGQGTSVGVEHPSYERIASVYRVNGMAVELLPLDDTGIAPEALARCQAKLIHVTPYHSYPSGITATPQKRKAYIDHARATGAYIVEDDFCSEFSVQSRPMDTIYSFAPNDCVIYLNTFSQTLAPSIRIGYMILPEPLMTLYEQKLGFTSCTVPVFDQLVLAAFIDSGEFERHINRTRRALRAGIATKNGA